MLWNLGMCDAASSIFPVTLNGMSVTTGGRDFLMEWRFSKGPLLRACRGKTGSTDRTRAFSRRPYRPLAALLPC